MTEHEAITMPSVVSLEGIVRVAYFQVSWKEAGSNGPTMARGIDLSPEDDLNFVFEINQLIDRSTALAEESGQYTVGVKLGAYNRLAEPSFLPKRLRIIGSEHLALITLNFGSVGAYHQNRFERDLEPAANAFIDALRL